MMDKQQIILGLDVSTKTIGTCLYLKNGDVEDILKIAHYQPKIPTKIKGIEALLLKKKVFEEEFLIKEIVDKGFKVTDVVIEEPLLGSNNVNTVATLLRFNGMISDSVYRLLGVVPEYISSYDARKYAFPELMAIRGTNKKKEFYPLSKTKSAINKTLAKQHSTNKKDKFSCLTLFGKYDWDVDKKIIVWEKINNMYPDIEWVYDKKGNLRKENFDSSDALAVVLAYINMEKFGKYDFILENPKYFEDRVEYEVLYEDKRISHILMLK